MSKRILSMLLAIVLVVGMMHGMSITANAADVLVTGNWSSNTITYTLYDDGTMIISGNGSIPDNAFYKPGNGSSPTSDETIAKVTDNLKVLEIEDGITSIGQYAFYKCTKLEKVIIKGDLVSSMTQPMGKYAFAVHNRNTTDRQ